MRQSIVCVLMLFAVGLAASRAPADKLDDTARAIADQIGAEPHIDESMFAPAFLTAVPAPKLTALLKQMHASYGPVEQVTPHNRQSPLAGQFTVRFKAHEMPMSLTIDGSTQQVIGLWFHPAAPSASSIEQVIEQLKALPGSTSFQLAELGDTVKVLHAHNADEPLAVGSAFKLLILAAAVEQAIEWDRVIRLRSELRSLPSGEMQSWPAGAPVTVHTLALKMISISDNTATDELLHVVGREKVEAVQKHAGIAAPGRNVPFLTTGEAFRLKSGDTLRQRYIAGDAAARRAIVTNELPKVPLDGAKLAGGPHAIEHIEWFASTADLCRVMHWFARRDDRTALDILAVNPGLRPAGDRFAYIGYKGGSEAGVLNMTWLLVRRDGRRLALSATWNNPAAALDEAKFTGLMQAALNRIGSDAELSR